MAYKARVLMDSVSPLGVRLTTIEITFPRFVLAEFNTHRQFSRNSASSRAIPFEKQLERIMNDPFIPFYWGANQSGMQARAEISEEDREKAVADWLIARDEAVKNAKALHALGVHKQIVNRILEPFMWHTVIITATEWSNFYALRANPEAQPEIRRAAELMIEVFEASTPKKLKAGEWHLPLIQDDEWDWAMANIDDAIKVSVGRCARVSYLTHDGKRDHEKDVALYESLVGNGHMSPLEHVATPFSDGEWAVRRAAQSTVREVGQGLDEQTLKTIIDGLEFSGNFRGWTQFRKTVPNEHDFALQSQG